MNVHFDFGTTFAPGVVPGTRVRAWVQASHLRCNYNSIRTFEPVNYISIHDNCSLLTLFDY